jgi:LAGLIDADG endonuclease
MLSTFLLISFYSGLINLKNIRWGQSAWLHINCMFSSHQRLNIEQSKNTDLIYNHSKSINRSKLYNNKEEFYHWFVGFTDGDGCFCINYQISKKGKYKWSLFFKIGQSSYNLRALYYIKKELGYGTVQVESKTNMADYRLRKLDKICQVLFPIFDKYPLLTSKNFDYMMFKKAYQIITDSNIDEKEKDNLLLTLKGQNKPKNYISPIWGKVNYLINDTNTAKRVMSKYWVIGFTEAEGSFYIVKKDNRRLVHGFEITQKLDIIVLDSIARILGISVISKKTYNTVVTTNSRAINNIIDYYKNTMKGMKALEYRIWSRSFNKYKGNYIELDKVRNLMRKIRLIRLDKNFHIKSNDIKD